MVSNRYRANKSITNKVVNIDARLSAEQKNTTDPHLSTDAVTGANIEDGSITPAAFAGDAVTDESLGRGVVGTENLGVVNRVTSDGNFQISLPGKMQLDGAQYPVPAAGVPVPMVQDDGKNVVQGRTAVTATVDPLWTYGTPNVTLSTTGAVVPTTGWTTSMVKPTPGQTVKVVNDGTGWFIVGTPTTTLTYLNQIPLAPKNGWTQYDTNWHQSTVTKTIEGIVHLSGLITAAGGAPVSDGTVILTLPVGFRPDYDLVIPINNGDTDKQLMVRRGGDLEIMAGPYVANSYISLANIRFPAAGVASWKRFGIDSGFTYANSWTAWQFTEGYSQTGGTGGAGTITTPTTGGPAASPNSWGQFEVTTATTGAVGLKHGGSTVYNRVTPGRSYAVTMQVWSNTALASTNADLVFYDGANNVLLDGTDVVGAVAANTWTSRTLATVVAPAGAVYVTPRFFNGGATAVGVKLGLGAVTITEVETGANAKNDAGPLRMWKDPMSGQIFVQGVLMGGATTSLAAMTGVLPAAYQPANEGIFYSVASGNILGGWRVSCPTSTNPNVLQYGNGNNVRLPIYGVYKPNVGSLITWVNPGYSNGWAYYGAPYEDMQYGVSVGGIVYVRGLIRSGTVGTYPFVFPVGLRGGSANPPSNAGNLYPIYTADIRGRIDNRPDGGPALTTVNNAWASIVDLTFVPER